MLLYELRTYSLYVGKVPEAVTLYENEGWPALARYQDKLVGYFLSDVGTLNQIVHLWKFADDADRRRHWQAVFADDVFMEFARKLRPLIQSQTNQLLSSAPWGPSP